ncbi:hypothetical protein AB0O74_32610 [Streptomyces rubiginosohelvolus]|uniref:hypothetical protein n=1 Tax=Streptomyces rubiginosohelvolus TaxID=67362 RepID=UPI003420A08C|nr:hypothetical protein OG475_33960 [Streptomyces rubiginosohelvolus]
MQMTEPFAGTIAAVVPVIWLVGAVEVHQMMKIYLASARYLEDTAGEAEKLLRGVGERPTSEQLVELNKEIGERLDDGLEQTRVFPPAFLNPLWAAVVAALLLSEFEALRWLATDDPGPRPGLAMYMLVSTMVGFGAVTIVPAVVAMTQAVGHLRRGKKRHAAVRDAVALQVDRLRARVDARREQVEELRREADAMRSEQGE